MEVPYRHPSRSSLREKEKVVSKSFAVREINNPPFVLNFGLKKYVFLARKLATWGWGRVHCIVIVGDDDIFIFAF